MSREVGDHAADVIAVAVADFVVGVLGRTGLGRYGVEGRVAEKSSTRTFRADAFEKFADLTQRTFGADFIHESLGFEVLDHVPVPTQLPDQNRRDHLAVVGNGVVEGDDLDRGEFDTIAERAAYEHTVGVGHLLPILKERFFLAESLQSDGLVEVQLFHEVAVTLLVVGITLPDRLGEIDVRRLGDRRAEIHVVESGVRILHPDAADLHHTSVARVVGLVQRHIRVVQQQQHRSQLEGRARLRVTPDGVVLPLGVSAAGGAPQIHEGEDFARADLHHDRGAPDGVLGFELFAQVTVRHVLHIEIERRDHVQSIDRVDVVAVHDAAVKTPGDALARGPTVAAGQLFAIDGLDAVVASVAGQSDRAAPQFALRIDAFVAFTQVVNHAHVPVQERVFAQGFPFGVVDVAGKDLDGSVVAQGIVEFFRHEFPVQNPVDPAGDASFGAGNEGVLAVFYLVVFGMLRAEHATVFGCGSVAEIGGK